LESVQSIITGGAAAGWDCDVEICTLYAVKIYSIVVAMIEFNCV
jgi:hypothetical protein